METQSNPRPSDGDLRTAVDFLLTVLRHIEPRKAAPEPEYVEAAKMNLSVVYFLQSPSTRRIKIGTTTNLKARRAVIASAVGESLETLLVIDGGRGVERHLHEQFKADRLKGEWFDPSKQILKYIQENQKLEPHGDA